jgi:hypothetical protein
VSVDDPRVLVDGLVHADGRRFVWLVSECDEPLTARPCTPLGSALRPVAAGDADPPGAVVLPPYGVRVMELVTSEGSDG